MTASMSFLDDVQRLLRTEMDGEKMMDGREKMMEGGKMMEKQSAMWLEFLLCKALVLLRNKQVLLVLHFAFFFQF